MQTKNKVFCLGILILMSMLVLSVIAFAEESDNLVNGELSGNGTHFNKLPGDTITTNGNKEIELFPGIWFLPHQDNNKLWYIYVPAEGEEGYDPDLAFPFEFTVYVQESSLTQNGWNSFLVTINGSGTWQIPMNNPTGIKVEEELYASNDPGTNDPGTNDPGTNDPGTNDPGTNDPGTNDPGTNDPGTNDPGTNDPGTNDPGTNDRGTNDRGTNDPGTNNPGTNNPGTNNPGTNNPGTNDPGTNDPGTNDPRIKDPRDPDPGNPHPKDPNTGNPGIDIEGGSPPTTVSVVTIPEPNVPQSGLPKTGFESTLIYWLTGLTAAVALSMMTVFYIRKQKNILYKK